MTFKVRNGMSFSEFYAMRRAARAEEERKSKEAVAQKDPDSDNMRAEWFVHASRNGRTITLASPDGEDAANAMAESLRRNGWEASATIESTYKNDPRFYPLRPKDVDRK